MVLFSIFATSCGSGGIGSAEITDYGWAYDDGTIYYSVQIDNTSSRAMTPEFMRVALYDKKGEIIGTDENEMTPPVKSNDSVVFSGVIYGMYNEDETKPEDISFELLNVEDENYWCDDNDFMSFSLSPLTTTNERLNMENKITGGTDYSYSGTLVNDSGVDLTYGAEINLVFYDEEDDMIGGNSYTITDPIKKDEKVQFEIDISDLYKKYNYRVFAYSNWM